MPGRGMSYFNGCTVLKVDIDGIVERPSKAEVPEYTASPAVMYEPRHSLID